MGIATIGFGDLVREECIIDALSGASREEVLHQMATRLVEMGFCRATFPAAIIERERVHPSGLPMRGHKIAIPHTDAEHVRRSTILFARLIEPVEFLTMGNPEEPLQIRMVSMFALREKHLVGQLLTTLITVYQDHHALDAMLQAEDAREMFAILRTAVEKQGAAS